MIDTSKEISPALRVLHIVGGMNRGGVESWLMSVLRHIDRNHVKMDFLVHTARECAHDREIQAMGARILHCPFTSQPLKYRRRFQRILRTEGPFDVVHSHVLNFSGYTLRLAAAAGVPVRIAHGHSDTSRLDREAGLARRLYLTLTRKWIHRYATNLIGCSDLAAKSLFGMAAHESDSIKLLRCGVNLKPFATPVDRAAVRRELGLPEHAVVLGHVGRFHTPKNHRFCLRVAAEVIRRNERVHLLLVGDGTLRQEVEAEAAHMGLGNRVVFTGARDDVARLMRGAMDAFLFPSLHEGLPLTLIEAQAAGLEAVVSDSITTEVDIVPGRILRLSLSAPLDTWRRAVEDKLRCARDISQNEVPGELLGSDFDIERNVRKLVALYRGSSAGWYSNESSSDVCVRV